MAYYGTQRIQCEHCRQFQALQVRKDRRIVHVPIGNRLPGGLGVSSVSNAAAKVPRHKLWCALKVFREAGIDVSHVELPREPSSDDEN